MKKERKKRQKNTKKDEKMTKNDEKGEKNVENTENKCPYNLLPFSDVFFDTFRVLLENPTFSSFFIFFHAFSCFFDPLFYHPFLSLTPPFFD